MPESKIIAIDRIPDGGQPIIRIARNSRTGEQIARDDDGAGIAGEFGGFDELIESKPGEDPKIIVIDRLRS